MVSNLPSYNYVSSLKNTDAALVYRDQLLKIMLGFMPKRFSTVSERLCHQQ